MTTPRFLFILNGVNYFMDKDFTEKFSTLRDSFDFPILEEIGDNYIFLDYNKFSEKEKDIISYLFRNGPLFLNNNSIENFKDAVQDMIKEGLVAKFNADDFEYGYGWQLEACGKNIYSMFAEDSEVIAFNF